MSRRDANVDRRDRPPDAERTDEGDTTVILEIAVPTEAFLFEEALRKFPGVVVELEMVVPTCHRFAPFFWASDGETTAFRDAVETDPKMERVRQVETFDEGALYQAEWRTDDGLLDWCANSSDSVILLQAEGQADEWILKFRFPSREALGEFRSFYEERDVSVRLVRLYDLAEPKMGQYNVTDKQRETLVEALRMGYFEIPRRASLGDVAESLGISPNSASERLRRGNKNLVSNTLTIGYPTGIGLDDRRGESDERGTTED